MRNNMSSSSIASTIAAATIAVAALTWLWFQSSQTHSNNNNNNNKTEEDNEIDFLADSSYAKLIGNTPLIKLATASKQTGRDIFVKMESMNPGGTGKDRAVKHMLLQKLRQHHQQQLQLQQQGLRPLGKFDRLLLFEGTSGSTGISLAALCASVPHLVAGVVIVMPDDQAMEKVKLLQSFGARVVRVPNCGETDKHSSLLNNIVLIVVVVVVVAAVVVGIANENHYVNTARRMAQEHHQQYLYHINNNNNNNNEEEEEEEERVDAVFVDQFENEVNWRAHLVETGPELLQQLQQHYQQQQQQQQQQKSRCFVNAFVMSAGTGGTIAGISNFLKEKDSSTVVVLADPPGSSLAHFVNYKCCFHPLQQERTLRKHRYDTIVEGVGLDRVTANFEHANIDSAISINDQEVVDTAHWLLRHEGLFVGSSSSLNVAAAIRTAKTLPEKSVVVTVVCDNGQRHLSRFWNQAFIEATASNNSNNNNNNEDGGEQGNSKFLVWPAPDVVPACFQ